MTHDEIVAECMVRDATPGKLVHYISIDAQTFRLFVVSVQWGSLSPGERYSLIKSGNYFNDVHDARWAITLATTHASNMRIPA